MKYTQEDLPSYFKDMVVDYISLNEYEPGVISFTHTKDRLDTEFRHPDDRYCTNYLLMFDEKNKVMKMNIQWMPSFSTILTIMMAKV